MENEMCTLPSGFRVHVAPDHVWIEFRSLTGPRAILNLECLVADEEALLSRQARDGILAWCREARLAQQLDAEFEEDSEERD